jgi:hypothetical protein
MKRGIQGSNAKVTTKTANNSICIGISIGEYLPLSEKYDLSQSKLSRAFIMGGMDLADLPSPGIPVHWRKPGTGV